MHTHTHIHTRDVLLVYCCVGGVNEKQYNNDTQQFMEVFTSSVSIMYSCAVTADSRKKELQRRVSSKVRHWCSKFIWCCHSSKRPRRWNSALAQWEGIIAWPEHAPSWGVKAVLSVAGSQFTQGKQARQPSDKQFGLNKAFRYKGRATTSYLSWLWRPPLALACLLSWRHLTYIHPS